MAGKSQPNNRCIDCGEIPPNNQIMFPFTKKVGNAIVWHSRCKECRNKILERRKEEMADYCKQCSTSIFGEDFRDLANLCGVGQKARVICEGCGYIHVDHSGNCLSEDCAEQHNKKENNK